MLGKRDIFPKTILVNNITITIENFLRFPEVVIKEYLSKEISEDELRKYSLRIKNFRFKTRNHIGDKNTLLWADDDGTFILLFYEETLICFIGFYDSNPKILEGSLKKERIIFQIQAGVFYDEKGLNIINHNNYITMFEWKKVLVQIVEKLTESKKYNNIVINSSEINFWGEISDLSKKGEHGYNIYDQTALDLGYSFNIKKKYYSKILN